MTGARTRRGAIMVAGLAVAVAGCGSSESSSRTDVQHLTIIGNDAMRFVPADPVVHPGTVVITLVARGTAPHNIDIPSLHAISTTILGGQRTSNHRSRPGRQNLRLRL
jgi:plastocyanin